LGCCVVVVVVTFTHVVVADLLLLRYVVTLIALFVCYGDLFVVALFIDLRCPLLLLVVVGLLICSTFVTLLIWLRLFVVVTICVVVVAVVTLLRFTLLRYVVAVLRYV